MYQSDIYFVGVQSPPVSADFWVYAPASFTGETQFYHNRVRLDHLPADFPVNPYMLDGTLMGLPLSQVPNGEGVVVHLFGWTILSFWDTSGSTNTFFAPRSCTSNFVMRGTFTFADAVAKAQTAFPVIWARFDFEVREKPGTISGEKQ